MTTSDDRDRLIHILVVHYDMFRDKAEEAADLFLHDKVLAAAKVRANSEGDGEWQPMDSAPLNGRHCILAVKEGPFVYSVQGAYDGKQWNCVHRDNVNPLYWMPNKLLPEGWESLASIPATGGEKV